MKTQIITSILLILIIGLASAEVYTIEAGESITIQLLESYASYNITGNLSEVHITQIGLDVTINVSKYEQNSFNITFYNEKEEVIYHSSGGWVRPNIQTNVTNQTNKSEELPEILPFPINQTEKEAWDISSDELNKETKNFFEDVLNFLKEYWLGITFGLIIGIVIVMLILYFYNLNEVNEIKQIIFPDEN